MAFRALPYPPCVSEVLANVLEDWSETKCCGVSCVCLCLVVLGGRGLVGALGQGGATAQPVGTTAARTTSRTQVRRG